MSEDRHERQATLSAADIGALAEHYRLALTHGSPLAAQSAESDRTDYAKLEKRGLLGPEWRAALTVLAAPERQARALIPGPDATLIPILYARRDQGWVGCWPDGAGLLVTFPWNADRILAMGYQVLMAEEPPPPDGLLLSLSLPGLTALASVIDALRAFLFRSLLNRLTFASPVLTRPELAGHLENGLLNPDSRWLVALLDVVGSPHFRLVPEGLPAGVEELERMGLLIPTAEGWQPVASVQRLALMWRSVLPAFALESLVVGDDGALCQYGHRIVIRGDGPLCQIDYGRELWSDAPSVTLRDVGPLECFNGLQALLADPPAGPPSVFRQREAVAPPAVRVLEKREEATPAPPPSAGALAAAPDVCSQCGQPASPGARFCQHCGGNMEGPPRRTAATPGAARARTERGTGRGEHPQTHAPVPLPVSEPARTQPAKPERKSPPRPTPQRGDRVGMDDTLPQATPPGTGEPPAAEPTCPHCRQTVSRGARFCRHCGRAIS